LPKKNDDVAVAAVAVVAPVDSDAQVSRGVELDNASEQQNTNRRNVAISL